MPWVLQYRPLHGVLFVTLLGGIFDGMFIPFLAITAEDRGVSLLTIGIMSAAFLLVQVVSQIPIGVLSDRWGRVGLITIGLMLLGLPTAGFAWAESDAWFVGLRIIQGIGVAALLPTLKAMVADVTPIDKRGPAFAAYSAAFIGGIFAGPVIGGAIVELASLNALFIVTAIGTAALAVWTALTLKETRPQVDSTQETAEPIAMRDLLTSAVIGACLLGAALQVMAGVAHAIWGIYLEDIGATSFEIGLSFSTFAVGMLVLVPLGGKIASRAIRWRTMLITFSCYGLFVTIYGFMPNVWWIIALGVLEGMVGAISFPTLDAFLVSQVDPRAQGRAQGAFATIATLGAALAGLSAALLYEVNQWLPFVATGCLIFVLIAIAIPMIRRRELAMLKELATSRAG